LYKSRHGLHWLMCQEVWDGPPPLKHAIFGADEVGEDLGDGPAHVTIPQDVSWVANAPAPLSVSDLLRRYDGKRMEELSIYPGKLGVRPVLVRGFQA
jgi:hypothetical protein